MDLTSHGVWIAISFLLTLLFGWMGGKKNPIAEWFSIGMAVFSFLFFFALLSTVLSIPKSKPNEPEEEPFTVLQIFGITVACCVGCITVAWLLTKIFPSYEIGRNSSKR